MNLSSKALVEEYDRDLEPAEQLALLVLFFCSGVSSLVYQVVWARMLNVAFDTSFVTAIIVLSAAMAGLALGSWFFGRLIAGFKRPLWVLAGLEAGIGLFALFFPLISSSLSGAYGSLAGLRGTFTFFPWPVLAFVLRCC